MSLHVLHLHWHTFCFVFSTHTMIAMFLIVYRSSLFFYGFPCFYICLCFPFLTYGLFRFNTISLLYDPCWVCTFAQLNPAYFSDTIHLSWVLVIQLAVSASDSPHSIWYLLYQFLAIRIMEVADRLALSISVYSHLSALVSKRKYTFWGLWNNELYSIIRTFV